MSTSLDIRISGNASRSLPTEVLTEIFTLVATQSSRRKSQSLLDLRLVCKSWSAAVIPIVLNSICIENVKQAQFLLENWKTIFSYTHDSQPRLFPVLRLGLNNLVEATYSKSQVSIDKAAELIRLFGENLRALDLDFIEMDCVTPLVDALRTAKSLTELDIQSHDSAGSSTLADLLDAIPGLEELTIGYSAVPPMKFSESALKKLRYLNFQYAYADKNDNDEDSESRKYSDLRGIVNICENAGSSLKIIKCFPTEEYAGVLLPVLKAAQEGLEGLFTLSLSHQWDYKALFVECPRLRVVSSHPWDDMVQDGGGWTRWPILRHARTLVFPIEHSLDPWLEYFEEAKDEKHSQPSTTSRDEVLFQDIPNLKQCLFYTEGRGSSSEYLEDVLPESLIEDFEAYGIKCFAIDDLEPAEIMELDAELDATSDTALDQ